jgi:DhnA family fructose-bisphosphate aldolase class Ia
VGRNVWQDYKTPLILTKNLKEIIFNGKSPEELKKK